MKKKSEAISTSSDYFLGVDLRPREKEIGKYLKELGMRVGEVRWRSVYHDGRVGAMNLRVEWKGKKGIAKIQGVKTGVSEWEMIEEFEKQNESKVIRVPKVWEYKKWDKKRGWELVVMEEVMGKAVVESGKLAKRNEIEEFFGIYSEYKKKSVRKPWLVRGESNYGEVFEKWKKMRDEDERSKIISAEDKRLIEKWGAKLRQRFDNEKWEFLHGHLSVNDVVRSGGKIVLFSNLFWKYRWPLADLVFGYEWYLLTIAGEGEVKIREQMKWWKEEMERVAKEMRMEDEYYWALRERMVAAMNLDVLMVPEERDRIKMLGILRGEIGQ